ncbi:MAG: penicillin-binding protein 2 [Peptococcaceae bacterium]|nr:penicillin-binding protein 2 [Peptococcaceae bacterium]
MDKKAVEKKMKIFTCVLAAVFLLLLTRLGFMQIVEAGRYRTLATQNHQRLITVQAPRGEIIDRNGVRLVVNKPVYTVSLVYLGLEDSGRTVDLLAGLLEGDVSLKGLAAQQIRQDIEEKIKGHQRLYEPVRVAVNVSQETVNKIEERRMELPGVIIDVEPVRYYPFGDLLGEVLGYVREITAEQLNSHRDEGYQMGDSFGQTGLEYTYESYLRGRNGARQVEVDAHGHPVRDLGFKSPVPGNSLVTTIDHRVQRAAQDAVAWAVEQTRNGIAKVPPGTPITGAAVVIDVNTGEVLAMVSIPSYDLNIFSQPLQARKYNELLKAGALRNHAIQTPYTPGSTFKMATLTALLEGKVVDPKTTIQDPGYYKYKKDWKPGGHGVVDAVGAIKNSCDTYFYHFGSMAGPELIGKYAAEYGLGQLTGIDLPGEEKGTVASRELKKKIWAGNDWESEWREYDSMDMAIGQQENKFTAVQLANYVAAIANGGTIYRPHLVKKVVSPDGADLKSFKPEVVRKVNVSRETLDIVREGMRQVATGDGTGSAAFWGAPYRVAAKTGTAEVGDKAQNSHALYVAYAPYEKPEVAVSVIIEYGYKGSSLGGPVARKILDAYFQAKKEDAGEIRKEQAPGAGQAASPAGQGQPGAVQPQVRQGGGASPPAGQEGAVQNRTQPQNSGGTGGTPGQGGTPTPGQGGTGRNTSGTDANTGGGQGGITPPASPGSGGGVPPGRLPVQPPTGGNTGGPGPGT